jgi:hypothetical protein
MTDRGHWRAPRTDFRRVIDAAAFLAVVIAAVIALAALLFALGCTPDRTYDGRPIERCVGTHAGYYIREEAGGGVGQVIVCDSVVARPWPTVNPHETLLPHGAHVRTDSTS